MLGGASQRVLTSAFLSTGHDLSYEHVTFVELDGIAVGMSSDYSAGQHRNSSDGPLVRAAGWRVVRMAAVSTIERVSSGSSTPSQRATTTSRRSRSFRAPAEGASAPCCSTGWRIGRVPLGPSAWCWTWRSRTRVPACCTNDSAFRLKQRRLACTSVPEAGSTGWRSRSEGPV